LAEISIHLLGPLRLQAEGQDLPPLPRKAQAMLVYLAGHAGKAQRRERIASVIWEHSRGEQAQRSLRQALMIVRRSPGFGTERILSSRAGDLTLRSDTDEIDLLDFERLVRSPEREHLECALELYRGEFLTDFPSISEEFDDWKVAMRSRVSTLAADALERLAVSQAHDGDLPAAVRSARRLVEFDPLREEAHRLLMRFYSLQGRRTEALRQFAACTEVLKRQLSVTPEAETLSLIHSISRGASYAKNTKIEQGGPILGDSHSMQLPWTELSFEVDGITAESLPVREAEHSVAVHENDAISTPTTAIRSGGAEHLVPRADKPSIGIFRFTNLSDNRDCDRFADCLMDSLIAGLSRKAAIVSGGRLSNERTDTVANHRLWATELQVQHLLTGSVRKARDRLRVTARLIDGRTGRHLWSERYDGFIGEPVALEDRISAQIDSSLCGILFDTDALPARRFPAEYRQLTVISGEIGTVGIELEALGTLIRSFHRTCDKTISRLGGVMARFDGEGFLAYFGYPKAQEHDAEQALRSCLMLIEEAGRICVSPAVLSLRLGIATGQVLVGDPTGSDAQRNVTPVGDALQVAVALRKMAGPDAILVAPSTRVLVGQLFEFRALGDLSIQGLDEPLAVSQVLRTSSITNRFYALHGSSLTPFVGREEEIELLLRRWGSILNAETRMVLVTGEPGIGKSRLAVAFQERLRGQLHSCIQFFCSPNNRESPLYPLIRQLENSAGFERNDSGDVKSAKLLSMMRARGPTNDEDAGLLAELLSLPPPLGWVSVQLPARLKRRRTFEALLRQLDATIARSPTLLVFEDIHWADPTTLELLDLMSRPAQRRLMILATFRPEFDAPWTGQAHVSKLTLSRLDRRETIALVQESVGDRQLPQHLIEEIADRTEGVPLLVEELSKAILETGLRVETAISRPVRGVPITLQGSLMARLDRLDPVSREVAQIGSVIGREFSYDLIAATCEYTAVVLQSALDQLVTSGLAFLRGAVPNSVYVFKHGLVHEVVYSTLLRSKRQQLHAVVADALERLYPEIVEQQPELVAHHLAAAGRAKSALTYWQFAIERELRTSAYREAIGHCTTALQAAETLEPGAEQLRQQLWLHLQQGVALTASLGPSDPAMLPTFHRASEISDQLKDDRSLACSLLGLWAHHNARANLKTALELSQRILMVGETCDEDAFRVQGHATSLTVSYKMGALEAAWEHFERGMKLIRPGLRVIDAIPNYINPGPDMLLHGSFVTWVMGYPERARQLAEDTIVAARRSEQPYTITHCVYMLGHLAELQEDWEAVRKSNEETVELATRWGFTGTLQLVDRRIALVAVVADKDEERFHFKCQHRQPGFARALHDVALARMSGLLGKPEHGLVLLREALAFSKESASCFYDAEVYRAQAQLFEAMGSYDLAEGSYLKAIETARLQRARMWELRAATDLARLYSARAKYRRAVNLLGPLCDWFTEGFNTHELQSAKALLDGLGYRSSSDVRRVNGTSPAMMMRVKSTPG
jgi:DNA-binding SARP family transcriptional activator/TolB-like protein/class 3 adenylate cyclase